MMRFGTNPMHPVVATPMQAQPPRFEAVSAIRAFGVVSFTRSPLTPRLQGAIAPLLLGGAAPGFFKLLIH